MAENIASVELLLAIIAVLAGGQLVVIGFFARKYIKRIDSNTDTINQLKTEHCIIHKGRTGMS